MPNNYQLEHESCITGLAKLTEGSIPLIIADPPYNQGQLYEAYNDNVPVSDYVAFTKQWLSECEKVLEPGGALCVFIPDEYVSMIDVYCRETLHMKRRHWIIWHFTFGQHNAHALSRTHVHILHFTKPPHDKWVCNVNDKQVRVPSARQLKYKDPRANKAGKTPADVWVLLPEHLPEAFDKGGDTWLVSRICGTFKERYGNVPNQLPVEIVKRLVLLFSNKGDTVVDPFLGSGTTGHAALETQRRFIGFDVAEGCIDVSKKRLANIQTNNG